MTIFISFLEPPIGSWGVVGDWVNWIELKIIITPEFSYFILKTYYEKVKKKFYLGVDVNDEIRPCINSYYKLTSLFHQDGKGSVS